MNFGISTVLGITIIIFIILIFNECTQSYYRNYCRKYYYKKAVARALELDKPLIVIGDPHNGLGSKFHGPAYGSGNFLIDISGCTKNICKDIIERDLNDSLKIFHDNSCVIFISCVLEYIEPSRIIEAIQELNRVAGNLDNIFVVTVGTSSLSSYYYTYSNGGKHKDRTYRVFLNAPPHGNFSYQEINQKNKRE